MDEETLKSSLINVLVVVSMPDNGGREHTFEHTLGQAVADLGGRVEFTDAQGLSRRMSQKEADSPSTVILTPLAFETFSDDLSRAISQVRGAFSEARCVVASAAPDWREAHKVMTGAGAGYMAQSLDRGNLIEELEVAIDVDAARRNITRGQE